MNVIEKIHLVQEINQILVALDSQKISFFEIAKSRQRLKEIYKLCDDPIFHQQQVLLQALTQPKTLALEFAKTTPFYETYQGFFIRENALKTQIIAGWALLQNAAGQWKAWLIFSDEGYVASSEWHAQLNDLLPWLEQQYEQRNAVDSTEKSTYLTDQILIIDLPSEKIEKNVNPKSSTPHEGAPLTRRIAYQNTAKMLMNLENFSSEQSPLTLDLKQNLPPVIAMGEVVSTSLSVKEQTECNAVPVDLPVVADHVVMLNTSSSDDVEERDDLILNLGQTLLRPKASVEIDTDVEIQQQDQDIQTEESQTEESRTEDTQADEIKVHQESDVKEQATHTLQGAIDLGEVQPAISLNLGSSILASVRNLHKGGEDTPPVEHQEENEETIAPVSQDLQQIEVAQYQGRLQRLSSAFTDEPHTYALQLEQTPPTEYLELLAYSETEQDLSHFPIYIAEQINLQERLSQYVVLFGAKSATHALKIIQDYVTHTSHRLLSVCEVDWKTFDHTFLQFESFAEMYLEQTQIIWRKEGYLPYIPVEFIHLIKMLPFEEQIAENNTPILLLNDRLKLRLIHGKNRINLSKNESAYPALIFDRKDGVSWQLVKTALSELPKPVDVYQLYKKIQDLVQVELS